MAGLRMSSDKKTMKRKYAEADKQEDEYEVEAILDKKTIDGKEHFQVKWIGWPVPTWEPTESCVECTGLIKDFERRRKAGTSSLPANTAGKASTSRFKVERGAKVAQVVGINVRDKDDGTRIVFSKVQYDDKTTEIVPSDVLLKECPMTLIAYYESLLKFE